MEKLNFNITIDAPREKVWKVLWDDATYPKWTSAFSETSYAETDWQEGSKVLFGDGSGNGMVSRIAVKRENEFLSFEHLGELKDGVEIPNSDWAGAREEYTLKTVGGKTELHVEMDSDGGEFAEMFKGMWPRALAILKELSESSAVFDGK